MGGDEPIPARGSGGSPEREERFHELFRLTTLPQALADPAGALVMANPAYCDLVGYHEDELYARGVDAITHPDDLPGWLWGVAALASGVTQRIRMTRRYVRADGTVITTEVGCSAVRDGAGEIRYLHDAIEQVHPQRSGPAPATGGRGWSPPEPVWAQARHRLGALLAEARGDQRMQVALVRLPGLAVLGGSVGLPAVDVTHGELLARLAEATDLEVLMAVPVALGDMVVVVSGADAGAVLALLQTALRAPLTVAGLQMPVEVRIGLTTSGCGERDPDRPLRQARLALAAALTGRRHEVRYSPALDAQALDDLALTAELATAIAHDHLELHYQGKFEISSGRLTGIEALLRWPHAERGPVPPDRVVPLAEAAGLIGPLTHWVIATAAAQAAAWLADAPPGLAALGGSGPVPVAVNIPPALLGDPLLPLCLSEAVHGHRLGPAALELEITETGLTTTAHAAGALHRLADLGFRISVDDFGTGYSSLASLKTLPLAAIKIDRAFIEHLCTDRRDQAIVSAVITLAHELGAQVVAEGVQDAATLALLGELGCDQAQGFYLHRPTPPPPRPAGSRDEGGGWGQAAWWDWAAW